jgi:hypothetical protein
MPLAGQWPSGFRRSVEGRFVLVPRSGVSVWINETGAGFIFPGPKINPAPFQALDIVPQGFASARQYGWIYG